MAFIPKPQFPNVPKLPGVPQLKRSLSFPAGPPPGLSGIVAVGRLLLALTSKPVWGIYKFDPASLPTVTEATEVGGDALLSELTVSAPPPVLVPDSFGKFQYKQEWQLPTVPVQEGAFASYNKINTPYEITVRVTKGGTLESRQEFLKQLEAIAASLDLYKIVTPERAYIGCNITGYRVVREGGVGAYFLTDVEITFIEIRQVTAQYTSTASNTLNAANPSARPVVNQGTLNAVPPISRVAAAVNTVLAPLRTLSAALGG